MATPKKSLSILCFGDSLTEGYNHYGMSYDPYSESLLKKLRESLSETEWDIDIKVDGVSGELVCAGFERRMKNHYLPPSPPTPKRSPKSTSLFQKLKFASRKTSSPLTTTSQSTPFSNPSPSNTPSDPSTTTTSPPNILLFLGGTNDLGWGKPIPEIHSTIQRCTAIPLSHGTKVILMTVPECGVNSKPLNIKRDSLNYLLKADTRPGLYIFDLHAQIPYHTMEEEEREEIWDDGLHFTKLGYARLGNLLAGRVLEVLKEGEEK